MFVQTSYVKIEFLKIFRAAGYFHTQFTPRLFPEYYVRGERAKAKKDSNSTMVTDGEKIDQELKLPGLFIT